MSPRNYYFMNHTRKEFCIFETNVPILTALEGAIRKNTEWSMRDDIQIDSEQENRSFIWWHTVVTVMNFKDLDMIEEH